MYLFFYSIISNIISTIIIRALFNYFLLKDILLTYVFKNGYCVLFAGTIIALAVDFCVLIYHKY